MKKILCALLMMPSIASAYQTEVAGGYATLETSNNFEASTIQTVVTRYFSPVRSEGRWYKENAFLQRAASASLFLGMMEFEFSQRKSDGPIFGISTVLMEKGSAYYLALGYFSSEYDLVSNTSTSLEIDSVDVTPGIFINDDTLIKFRVSQDRVKISGRTDRTSGTGIMVKHVVEKATIEGGLIRSTDTDGRTSAHESSNRYSLDTEYFLSNKVSVGVDLGLTTSDNAANDGKEIDVSSTVFIDEKLAFSFSYGKFNADSTPDYDSFDVVVAYRF
ncbi:hypothetical protein ACFL2V_12345 [Pseudomonadota bacterium]